MPKFPEPPPVSLLRTIEPDIQRLSAGTSLWRVYFRTGRYPSVWYGYRAFDPLRTARFDHHEPDSAGNPRAQDRAILYAALHGLTCIAKVFQSTRIIDQHSRTQRWARTFYDAYEIDGIIDPSSMYGNEPAVALFERCQSALPHTPGFHRALADPALQRRIAATAHDIGYDWL